jgi:hypothetical protein
MPFLSGCVKDVLFLSGTVRNMPCFPSGGGTMCIFIRYGLKDDALFFIWMEEKCVTFIRMVGKLPCFFI